MKTKFQQELEKIIERPLFPRTIDEDRWITVENGEHVLLGEGGEIKGGMGGKYTGKKIGELNKKNHNKGLTPEQQSAIKEYTTGSYHGINNYLKNGYAINEDVIKGIVSKMDTAIDNAPPITETVLYRGTSLDEILNLTGTDFVSPTLKVNKENVELLKRKLINKEYKNPTYLSTSKDSVLDSYVSNVEMRITNPKSLKGIDVSKISDVKHEKEVLLARNERLSIKDVQMEKGRFVIYAEKGVNT